MKRHFDDSEVWLESKMAHAIYCDANIYLADYTDSKIARRGIWSYSPEYGKYVTHDNDGNGWKYFETLEEALAWIEQTHAGSLIRVWAALYKKGLVAYDGTEQSTHNPAKISLEG